jgi:hypothetical protein
METTFLISLVGTALWLGGLWFMPRSLRAGMGLHLASTAVFAVLNIQVGAYPGLVGAGVGVVIMVRAIRRARPRRRSKVEPTRIQTARPSELERVWAEAVSRAA